MSDIYNMRKKPTGKEQQHTDKAEVDRSWKVPQPGKKLCCIV